MKNSIRFLLVAIVATAALAAQAQKIVTKISGYPSGDYRISPAMSQQLTTKVVEPIKSALQRSPNSEITIEVDGYADKSGHDDANAHIANTRAENVYNFLGARVSNKVNLRPVAANNGANERAVIVTVTITTVTSQPQSKTLVSKTMAILIVMAIGIAFLLSFRKRSDKLQPASEVANESLVPAAPLEEIKAKEPRLAGIVECERNEIVLEIPIFEKDGIFSTPFAEPNDFKSSLRDAKKAVKNALKNPNHPEYVVTDEQLRELDANGKITIKKGAL